MPTSKKKRAAGKAPKAAPPVVEAPAVVDEPLIEAVMLGQSGNAGISFVSRGRALKAAPER